MKIEPWTIGKSLRIACYRASSLFLVFLLFGASFKGQARKNPPLRPEMKPFMAHTSWTGRDGAPDNIAAIAQTQDGYLWLGTPQGLYRFDGSQFSSYPVTPLDAKLPASDIDALCADPQGGLWIGFRIGGISHLSIDGELANYNKENKRGPNSAQKIVVRADQSVWALGDDKLLELRSDVWEDFGSAHGLPDDQLLSLFFDRNGNLWTSARHELFVLRKGKTTFDLYPTKSFMIVDFAEMPDGQLWISDGWRLVRPLEPSARHEPIPVRGYARILIEPSGVLWIAQDYRGVSHLSVAASKAPNEQGIEEPELSSEQTNSIMRDRGGNIWVGTSRGLDRMHASPLRSLSGGRVEYYPSLAFDGDKGVWVATLAHPVLHATGEKLTLVGKNVGSSPIVCDDKGRLWMVDPTHNSLIEIDGAQATRIPVPDPVHHAPAQSIGLDRDGAILVSFDEAGLWRFDGGWNEVHGSNLPAGYPLVIFRDPAWRVWLGYANGSIIMHDDLGFHPWSSQQAGDLGNLLTFAIAHDRLWAAGTNGLSYLEKGSFHRVSLEDEGLLRGISGIVEDQKGDLWLNAASGIIRIDAGQVNAAIVSSQTGMSYDLLRDRQGLLGTATQLKPTPSAVSDHNGLLWFSTSGHVFSIAPETASLHQAPPALNIQNVAINGTAAMDREHQLSEISKSAGDLNELEIDYVGIDLAASEKVKYKYMLEGEDKAWRSVGSRRQAFYSHLAPGRYRFKVAASSEGDNWTELAAPFALIVTPAFYQTGWFSTGCVLVVLALLYILYLLRVQAVTRRLKSRMKERSSERLRIARDLHDTLLQSIHGLVLRVHFATEELPASEPVRQSLQQALSRADAVILEGRRRVQDLRDEIPDSRDLAAQLARIAEEIEIHKSMAFKIIEDGRRRDLDTDVQRELCMIAREALTNTLRHSKAESAEVLLTYGEASFLMKCVDTGIGVEPGIFAKGNRAGHWGLVGIRERAVSIQSNARIWSSPRAGTEIEIRVPARRAYRYPPSKLVWLQRLFQIKQDAEGGDAIASDGSIASNPKN
jgi:signal transduction histidine kinase/ligand-binding sensor domain-containing protein